MLSGEKQNYNDSVAHRQAVTTAAPAVAATHARYHDWMDADDHAGLKACCQTGPIRTVARMTACPRSPRKDCAIAKADDPPPW